VAILSMVGYGLLALTVISCAIISLRMRNLVIAAAALGIGSAALAMLFFFLDAPYAGGFELSVGAGLVSVLFLVAISLATTQRQEAEQAPSAVRQQIGITDVVSSSEPTAQECDHDDT
jgi:NADH:ubiquinone oxidoreductase subunit 6 (subunit J)